MEEEKGSFADDLISGKIKYFIESYSNKFIKEGDEYIDLVCQIKPEGNVYYHQSKEIMIKYYGFNKPLQLRKIQWKGQNRMGVELDCGRHLLMDKLGYMYIDDQLIAPIKIDKYLRELSDLYRLFDEGQLQIIKKLWYRSLSPNRNKWFI